MTEKESPGVPGNAFPQLLSVLENGDTQNEASRKLTQLVERVTTLRKPGKLILTLTVERASGMACNFSADVVTKMPKAPADQTLLFVDPDKGYVLSKNNPKQKNFDFAEVQRPVPQVSEEIELPDKQFPAVALP